MLSHASSRFGALVVGGFHDWNKLHDGDGTVENTGYEGDSYFGSLCE